MCDRAGRIRHDLFSIFPVSILISWGQTPAVRTESPVRSGQGAIVPLAAHYPVEVFPSKAALGGYRLSGRSARRFSWLVQTPTGD